MENLFVHADKIKMGYCFVCGEKCSPLGYIHSQCFGTIGEYLKNSRANKEKLPVVE